MTECKQLTSRMDRGVFATRTFESSELIQTDAQYYTLDYTKYCSSGPDKERNITGLHDADILALHILLEHTPIAFMSTLYPFDLHTQCGVACMRSVAAVRRAAQKDRAFHALYNVPDAVLALTMAKCRTNFFRVSFALDSVITILYVLSAKMAMFNHSCDANAQFVYNPTTRQCEMRATRQIHANDEITLTYLNQFQLRTRCEHRRRLINVDWHFTCLCARCMRESETIERAFGDLAIDTTASQVNIMKRAFSSLEIDENVESRVNTRNKAFDSSNIDVMEIERESFDDLMISIPTLPAFDALPPELVDHLLSYLTVEDILRKQHISRSFNASVDTTLLDRTITFDKNKNCNQFHRFQKSKIYERCVEINMPDAWRWQVVLPETLQRFIMGNEFDCSITLPESLIYFVMGDEFRQQIELPASLIHLEVGLNYRRAITLPVSLRYFLTGCSFDVPIDLPETLTHLIMGWSFNRSIELPSTLTHLTMSDMFEHPIDLPATLTHLELGKYYNETIELPASLTHFKMGESFMQPVELPDKLIELTLGWHYNQPLPFFASLTHLILGIDFNHTIQLSESLTHFEMGSNYNQPITLPASLTHFKMGFDFNQRIALPESLTHLEIGYRFAHDIMLPNSLTCLSVTVHSVYTEQSGARALYFNTTLPDSVNILYLGASATYRYYELNAHVAQIIAHDLNVSVERLCSIAKCLLVSGNSRSGFSDHQRYGEWFAYIDSFVKSGN